MRVTGSDVAGNNYDRQIVFNLPTPSSPLQCPGLNELIEGDPGACVTQALSNPDSEQVQIFVGSILGNNNKLFANTPLEGLSQQVGTSGLAAIVSTILLLFNFIPFITIPGLIIQFVAVLIGKRNQNPWGVVTDSISGKPIPFAICQLFVSGSQFKINQTVTDLDGRYGFTISPGDYRLEVKQSGYDTYTKKINVTDGDTSHIFDVSLNPVGNAPRSEESFLRLIQRKARMVYLEVSKIILGFGFFFSLIAVLITFSFLNVVIFALYLFMVGLVVIRRVSRKPKFASVVNSHNDLRVPYAQVKIFDPKSWNLIDSIVCNYNGQFDFYGKPGKYGLLVVARGYEFPSGKNNFPVAKEKFNSIVLVKLKSGGNKLDLYVDPIYTETQKELAEAGGNMSSPFS